MRKRLEKSNPSKYSNKDATILNQKTQDRNTSSFSKTNQKTKGKIIILSQYQIIYLTQTRHNPKSLNWRTASISSIPPDPPPPPFIFSNFLSLPLSIIQYVYSFSNNITSPSTHSITSNICAVSHSKCSPSPATARYAWEVLINPFI